MSQKTKANQFDKDLSKDSLGKRTKFGSISFVELVDSPIQDLQQSLQHAAMWDLRHVLSHITGRHILVKYFSLKDIPDIIGDDNIRHPEGVEYILCSDDVDQAKFDKFVIAMRYELRKTRSKIIIE